MATEILDMETEIKPYLDAQDASTDDEAFLESCESRLISMIEEDAQKRFRAGSAGEVLTFNAVGGSRLWLPYRASAVTAVEEREALNADWTAVDDYELSGSGRYIVRTDGLEFPEGARLVRATGTFGYAAASVPKDIRQLLLECLNWVYRRGRKSFLSPTGTEVMALLRKETNYDMILSRYRGPSYG